MIAQFKVNTREFTRTLRTYELYSKRDIPTILNTKGFFIARRAVIETPKADIAKMGRELGQLLTLKKNKQGKYRYSSKGLGTINSSRDGTAPLMAVIINARRGRKGLSGLQGAKMKVAMRQFWAVRAKSIAFLKSGWIPTIKRLQPLADKAGAPKQEAGVKQVGRAKGFAVPAITAWTARCIIANLANAKHDYKEALIRYGLPALQRAFDFEVRSMRDYVHRKQVEAARRAGIKFGYRLGR